LELGRTRVDINLKVLDFGTRFGGSDSVRMYLRGV